MGRQPMIAGNWKMYKKAGEAAILVQNMEELVEEHWHDVDIVICPPFTALKSVSVVIELDRLTLELGAQNVHWEAEGAFTGEISPPMLAELRCGYCIVGHSERREMFGETDETVNRKVKALLAHKITPIVCVGETADIREANQTEAVVRTQVKAALEGISAIEAAGIVIAYEPVWAIGTGRTPTPEGANDVARTIRATVGALFGPPAAQSCRVLYGGSVKPENAAMFFCEPDIDGALVGGAALDAESFAEIVVAAKEQNA
ncbi:MAG: triose-phosphate isomerase [Actinobacteria bacterium]|nr:triose-phosphate isomerase [Actinomycetota bacterium]MCL5888138.1 triose-phosphate isomerase [Actinomycetota bacterium]